MKTLIIWCEIPEKIKYYMHPAMTDDAIVTVKKCHGNFINQINEPDVDAALEELSTELNKGWFIEISETEIPLCKPDLICVTGIIL